MLTHDGLTHDSIRAVQWQDGKLKLLDQRALPESLQYLELTDVAAVASAIRDMVVRGAPAIGITAAYGVVIASAARWHESPATWKQTVQQDLALLAASRPTAVNLFWAIERMRAVIKSDEDSPIERLLAEAKLIHEEDVAANQRMGELGASCLGKNTSVLTHCNTGSLATGGYGTALGVIRNAFTAQQLNHVYADETRPWLQGSRLTAWELQQDHIPVTLIADSAAAYLMQQQKVQWVIVGADRITANGDVANKIGTYNLAVNARHHGVKFMVVAPISTIDMQLSSGNDIPIEQRNPAEVLAFHGHAVSPSGVTAWNPAFDITPAALIDFLVTERGVVAAPNRQSLAAMMKNTS